MQLILGIVKYFQDWNLDLKWLFFWCKIWIKSFSKWNFNKLTEKLSYLGSSNTKSLNMHYLLVLFLNILQVLFDSY